jgi:succinoglycan biosynthesis protein ExoA
MNQPECIRPITTKDGPQARAAQTKSLLNDIKRGRTVHLLEPALLISIVPRGAPSKHRIGARQLYSMSDYIMAPKPAVTIIVPTLNEEECIRAAITSLVPADESLNYEMIVLDGGSTDHTALIVGEMSKLNPRIRLEMNPARYQSAAVNRGAKIANPDSEIIVRADAHAEYPPGFVAGLVRELRQQNAESVVVPMRTHGTSFLQRGIATAQNSRLGNGGALHRTGNRSRYIDHGHHAAFVRRSFLAVGGYDESFTHNEDAELDIRLRKSGAKIWLCADLAISYFPRGSLGALARQYFNHGAGRARTMLKHRHPPKVRQLLPLSALGMNVLSLASGFGLGWPFFLPALAYACACLSGGLYLAISQRDPAGCAAGPAAIIMHQSWAAGFAYRALRLSIANRFRIPVSSEALR